MKNYYKIDEWSIIEEGFNAEMQEASESIFSLGNGHMGQRANFEEKYSGPSLQGTYIAGVYYPDKTRVGWWKNGYPEYFAKVLNAPSWIGIHVEFNGESLDLNTATVSHFRRELNMKEAFLLREFTAKLPSGVELMVSAKRFLSICQDEIGAISYSVKPLNASGKLRFRAFLDGDIVNQDSNYDEKFWDIIETKSEKGCSDLVAKTKKTGFEVGMSMQYQVEINGKDASTQVEESKDNTSAGNNISIEVIEHDEAVLYKYVAVVDSLNYKPEELLAKGQQLAEKAKQQGFHSLLEENVKEWAKKWSHSDIIIDGDKEAQQAIRFNIFQLNQTYTGTDERLNIGPKGFTGEKYGGSTYWDTEAYLIPFYLSTAKLDVARNLLIYRYKHLDKAIKNAAKLGFNEGAALYPMVTMNGEECHNEWEITFEEIHRNGAIAYAIKNYIEYTGDQDYLAEYGLEVLIGISRFWKQRVNWSDIKGQYVMLGVTGPNEYENNVNNNWYTNKMAVWTLQYTIDSINWVMNNHPMQYQKIVEKARFKYEKEVGQWKDVIKNMYFPYHEKLGIFLQQDGYMDKEQTLVSDLDPSQRPINQHWSWDRILRSAFIKQADVLQGIFCFENEYDTDTIRRNFDFYEPRTVHESSLSPCIHSILANSIGEVEQAYNFYLRTSRLDLDDYNKEVHEGLHITSMGGTWMSIVVGFGGLRVKDGVLSFNPHLPKNWDKLSFNINFRNRVLKLEIGATETNILLLEGEPIEVAINDKRVLCELEKTVVNES